MWCRQKNNLREQRDECWTIRQSVNLTSCFVVVQEPNGKCFFFFIVCIESLSKRATQQTRWKTDKIFSLTRLKVANVFRFVLRSFRFPFNALTMNNFRVYVDKIKSIQFSTNIHIIFLFREESEHQKSKRAWNFFSFGSVYGFESGTKCSCVFYDD